MTKNRRTDAPSPPNLIPIESRYTLRAYVLHGDCFYDGMCEPEDSVSDDVRDAEELVGRWPGGLVPANLLLRPFRNIPVITPAAFLTEQVE